MASLVLLYCTCAVMSFVNESVYLWGNCFFHCIDFVAFLASCYPRVYLAPLLSPPLGRIADTRTEHQFASEPDVAGGIGLWRRAPCSRRGTASSIQREASPFYWDTVRVPPDHDMRMRLPHGQCPVEHLHTCRPSS